MNKIDLTKQYKSYYTATPESEFRNFSEGGVYVGIDGIGEPAGEAFSKAVTALYPVAYGVKALCKAKGDDFGVPKLEGLWWVESHMPALKVPREQWHWKLLIRMPIFITKNMVETAKQIVKQKKKIELADSVTFEKFAEGQCAQVMHTGSYADESATITAMHEFIAAQGRKPRGLHHEIYLSDPRKTAPEKMKTILRQPVE